ncbi:MAG TPA: DUF1559 domain-containing protein [Pirellulaceae bacterium]|nr:DUF1559 domain-containing protein [Pirellulaceae bacterium]
MSHPKRRRGFTLVELLVVITIIGILMALLLPAGNYAVEAARQRSCSNNIRQLALSMVTFESKKERFPGYTNRVGNFRGSWCTEVLPYIERSDIYDRWLDGTKTSGYIEMFVCPSDPPDSNSSSWNSYVANAGHRVFTDFSTNPPTPNDGTKEAIANGVLHNYFASKANLSMKGPAISATQFKDGLTNTLLISENVQANLWDDVADGSTAVANDKISTVFVWWDSETANRKINGNKNTATLSADTARPSSHHPGGVNAAFADGHTVWLKQDIAYNTYVQLMTPRSADVKVPGFINMAPLADGDFK